MSQSFVSQFSRSPSFSNNSFNYFIDEAQKNQQTYNCFSYNSLNGEIARTQYENEGEIAYHTNFQVKAQELPQISLPEKIDQEDQKEKEIEREEEKQKLIQQRYQNIVFNNERKISSKLTGIYPIPYTQAIQKKESNFNNTKEKIFQSNANNSQLGPKKIEDRLYPLQFEQMKKLEQLRKYNFRKELSELKDPEIDQHSQQIIQNRPKQKIEERLLQEGKNIQQKQEQKVQEYEYHLKQIASPKINQSLSTPNLHESFGLDLKIIYENNQEPSEKKVSEVVNRLMSFQNLYQQKKNALEQMTRQYHLQECTFKPQITKKAQMLIRNESSALISPTSKTSKEQEIKRQQLNEYPFKPRIDRQSQILAQKLEKSFTRLTKPKVQKEFIKQSFKPSINKQSQRLVKRKQSVFEELYQRKQQYNANLAIKKQLLLSQSLEREQKENTFKPLINNYSQKSFIYNKGDSNELLNSFETSFTQKQEIYQRLHQ